MTTLVERFQRFTRSIDSSGPCWNWKGTRGGGGYGVFNFGRRGRKQAHRIGYEFFVGPIPEGKQLDHLCRNRLCVRPDHLEPVTNRENVLRGVGPTAQNAVVTHCPWGHPYAGHNVFWDKDGHRHCRACAIRMDMRRQRRLAAEGKAFRPHTSRLKGAACTVCGVPSGERCKLLSSLKERTCQ